MSLRFAQFLVDHDLVWDELSLEQQGQLRLELTRQVNDEPSRTVQSDAAGSDVNVIVARARAAGLQVSQVPFWSEADASVVPSFQESLNMVARSREWFERLPSRLRERFGNDPQRLFEFVGDKENREEAIRLGLLKKPEEPKAPEGAAAARPAVGSPEGASPGDGA